MIRYSFYKHNPITSTLSTIHFDADTSCIVCYQVISKSIAQLNSSDVLKLLHSLISIIQSRLAHLISPFLIFKLCPQIKNTISKFSCLIYRGAILVCALPWLNGLLLQHASRIMSQESSLLALNSLYQVSNVLFYEIGYNSSG